MNFDLIVIGGGPAGYHGAERAAKQGLKVLLIEKNLLGGVCLNEGCIPTKTLLYSAKIKDNASHGAKYGVVAHDVSLDHGTVMKRKQKVVSILAGGVQTMLKAAGVKILNDEAHIVGKNEKGFLVQAGENTYTSQKLFIATGSKPMIPPIPGVKEGLESGFILTSKEALDLHDVPKKFVVIGGGVIGLEMASYFQSAGSEVTVIEMLEKIGGTIDDDIADILKKSYEAKGIRFFLGSKVTEIKDGHVVYEQADKSEIIEADRVLLSIGRRACINGFGIEKIRIATDRGAITTDMFMQTNVKEVYAAGDVTGRSMLAHTAYREAEAAINHMVGIDDAMHYHAIPGVIYTNSEVAGVGETQASAKEKGLDVIVKSLPLYYSGRYVAENHLGNGIIKVIADKNTKRILGVHMISSYASEIIYGADMMIEQQMVIDDIKKVVFPHPTVSEIVRDVCWQFA